MQLNPIQLCIFAQHSVNKLTVAPSTDVPAGHFCPTLNTLHNSISWRVLNISVSPSKIICFLQYIRSRTASGHHQRYCHKWRSKHHAHNDKSKMRSLTLTYSMVGSMPAASLQEKVKTRFSEHISYLSVCACVERRAVKQDWTLTCVWLAWGHHTIDHTSFNIWACTPTIPPNTHTHHNSFHST